jgi:hypothetical protein
MAVALHAAADDLVFQHAERLSVERGEQRRGAVPLVVVGHRSTAALLQRQAGLGAIERLNLRFLVDRQHHRMRRRVDVEADDVTQLFDKRPIARQLELTHAMGLQPVGAPDPLDRPDADPERWAGNPAVQWVVSSDGLHSVSATARSRSAVGSAASAPGASCRTAAPSTPCAMKRSCQRHTVT